MPEFCFGPGKLFRACIHNDRLVQVPGVPLVQISGAGAGPDMHHIFRWGQPAHKGENLCVCCAKGHFVASCKGLSDAGAEDESG